MPIQTEQSTGFFEDKLLVATHSVSDGCFDKTVIYICAHNHNGALGVIVNMPLTGISVRALMKELEIKQLGKLPDRPIYFGGPVDTNQGFILHSNDAHYPGTIEYKSGISFSSGVRLLEDMGQGCGPQQCIVTLGCAGWGAGQLEEELEKGSWIIAPATPELLFDTSAEKLWTAAAGSLGVDLDRLDANVGHA